jgi:hypothetical protein
MCSCYKPEGVTMAYWFPNRECWECHIQGVQCSTITGQSVIGYLVKLSLCLVANRLCPNIFSALWSVGEGGGGGGSPELACRNGTVFGPNLNGTDIRRDLCIGTYVYCCLSFLRVLKLLFCTQFPHQFGAIQK